MTVRRLESVDLNRSISWRAGTLYFDKEPLEEVLAELSRYTAVKVIVRNASIERLPIGGSFEASADGAEALFPMRQDGFGLSVDRAEGSVFIDPAATK